MARVLAIDAGMTFGYGVRGPAEFWASGSLELPGGNGQYGKAARVFDERLRQLVLEYRPDAIGFASPFVAMVTRRDHRGALVRQPIAPENIRPLFGMTWEIERIATELGIRCLEDDEPKARDAFLMKVPRKSKDIKLAVQEACRMRGWRFPNEHAADALCMADFFFAVLSPKEAHASMPLFRSKGARAHEQPSR